METIKNNITIDRNIGKETSQILLEGEIIVPDTKPDIEALLQKSADICIDSYDIVNERISFKGNMEINIIYLARSGEKPVHNINYNVPINDFISMDGIDKDMWADISANITNMDYKIINDRKISFRAVVDVTGKVTACDKYETVVGIEGIPESQVIKKRILFNKTADKRKEKISIKDEISVPSGKPNIIEVLQMGVTVVNKDIKCMDNKVNVSGELVVDTLYKGETDDSVAEFMDHEIPFNGSFDINGIKDGMFSDIDVKIHNKSFKVKQDDDGENRVIEIEIYADIYIEVSCEDSIEVLEDAYCINKKTEKDSNIIKYPSFVCRNKNQFPVKEVVQTTEDCPNILQVFKVTGNVALDEVKVIPDKIIAEGIINADILYVAENDEVPLYCYSAVVPYKQIIEAKGVLQSPDMWISIKSCIDRISFSMLSNREIELKFVLNFSVCVTCQKQAELIGDICFDDLDKCILDDFASMTIYVVQPGDTLWKIAKRYNTSVDDIVRVNDIENPDLIYPGEKFLILKNISENDEDCDKSLK